MNIGEMIMINGEALKTAIKNKGMKFSEVSNAVGLNDNYITNCAIRNKIAKEKLEEICIIAELNPDDYIADKRLEAIMEADYDDEEEPEQPTFPKPQEGPIETRFGKILQGAPIKQEPVIKKVYITNEVFERRWMELKQFFSDAFVAGKRPELTEIILKIVELEEKIG